MSLWDELTAKYPAVRVFTLLGLGAAGGLGFYFWVLGVADLETVRAGSWISRDEILAEGALYVSVVDELEDLIEFGEVALELGDDTTRRWLLRTVTFIHEVRLEPDAVWEGRQVSTVERDLRWALTDSILPNQARKALGILEGLVAALRTRRPER